VISEKIILKESLSQLFILVKCFFNFFKKLFSRKVLTKTFDFDNIITKLLFLLHKILKGERIVLNG